MKKLKDILFKPNGFKEILSNLFILFGAIIGYSIGYSIGKITLSQQTELFATLLIANIVLCVWSVIYKIKNK